MRNTVFWLCCIIVPLVGCHEKSLTNTDRAVSSPPETPEGPASVAEQQEPTALVPPIATPAPLSKEAPQSPLKKGNLRTNPPPLDDVNRWATEAGVRDNLIRWVESGLNIPVDVSTNIDIKLSGGEVPNAAVVTVTLDGYLDDSVRGERFELKFSRKACDDCDSGMSGWWLYSLGASVRCYEGRGHTDYSVELCK